MRTNQYPILKAALQYILCGHGITEAYFTDAHGDIDGKCTIYLHSYKSESTFDISKLGDLLSSVFRVQEIPMRLRMIDASVDTDVTIPRAAQQLISKDDSFAGYGK